MATEVLIRERKSAKHGKTFEEGFEEFVLDMKARNLRQGTISLIQKQATQHKRTCESLRNEQNYNLQVS